VETKHTPGPWVVRDEETGPNGETETRIVAVSEHRDLPLANVWHTDHGFGDANANLIAAAPDLLALVQFCADVFNAGGDRIYASGIAFGDDDTTFSDHCLAAIARATGQY
jgi:hypothetical protein